MPLLGLVLPTHTERKRDEDGRYPEWATVADILAEARDNDDPKWSPWPYELIFAAVSEWQERDYFSTTMFTGGCRRGTVVERKEPFIYKLDDLYASIRGTLVHRTLEYMERPGGDAEVRFFTEVDETEVSCSPDLITANTIWDWKTTNKPPLYDYPWPNHKRQLQYNRFIVNHATRWEKDGKPYDLMWNPWERTFEHLAVVYLGPDAPKTLEVTESVQVPTVDGKSTKPKRLPSIWSDEEAYAALSQDLEAMQAALRAYPEWPAGLEDYPGWAGPPTWACPGPPLCFLPNCMAKRWPDRLVWGEPR